MNTELHPAHDPRAPSDKKMLESKNLFEGQREIIIKHQGEDYRLRITKAGKLILNK